MLAWLVPKAAISAPMEGATSEEPPPTRAGTDCAITAEAAITESATATA